jgi:hypothetical protein
MLAAPVYWLLTVRDGQVEPRYLDNLITMLARAAEVSWQVAR